MVSGQELEPRVVAVTDTFDCYNSFSELKFTGAGADSFQWNVQRKK